jgi:hypothetical protein
MNRQVRDAVGHKPRTHRNKARRQFLAVAKKKQPDHLERNLASIDALIGCGASLLAAGRHWYKMLLVVSEVVRQQRISYHSDRRSIPH